MEALRKRFRQVVLAITALLITLLLIRITLLLVGTAQSHPLVQGILSLTGPLVAPFSGFDLLFEITGFDLSALVAIVVYAIMGILIVEVFTAFMYDKVEDIVINVVDGIFKWIEFLLVCRIVFALAAINPQINWFVQLIYNATNWSTGLVNSVRFVGGFLEISTMIVLVIVVAIDLATEGILKSLFTRSKKEGSAPKEDKPAVEVKVEAPKPAQPVVVQAPAPQAVPQNITINVPVPVMPNPAQPRPTVVTVQPQAIPQKPREG